MSIVLFTSFGGPYTIIYAIFICIIGISNGPVSSPKKKRLNKKNGRLSQLDKLSTAWNFIKLWEAEDEISGN